MKLFRWCEGRKKTGYKVFTLIYSKFFKLDCCIIKYSDGDMIPLHTVPVKNGFIMYRLNIIFWNSATGGQFYGNTIFNLFERVILFRPDIAPHSVSTVRGGNRFVLSIGKLFRGK